MLMPRAKPLLGDTDRIWAGLTLAACVIVVLLIGLLFQGQTSSDSFDNAVDSPVIALSNGHDALLYWLIVPGTLIPAIAISVVIAAGCLMTRRLNGAVLAVIVVPAATGLDDGLLKHLVHRAYLGGLSFPSGHTTCVTALTATIAILLLVPPQQARTRSTRVLLVAVACLVTSVVAVGVIGVRFHYFTDTVAGAAVGVGTALALALLLDFGVGAMDRLRNLSAEHAANKAVHAAPVD
jgi:membrane-associated phospholipid phosphatase